MPHSTRDISSVSSLFANVSNSGIQRVYLFSKCNIVCLFDLLLYVPVNSFGDYGMVSLPNHTFP